MLSRVLERAPPRSARQQGSPGSRPRPRVDRRPPAPSPSTPGPLPGSQSARAPARQTDRGQGGTGEASPAPPAADAGSPKVPPPPKALIEALPRGSVFLDFLRYTDFEQDATRPGSKGRAPHPALCRLHPAAGAEDGRTRGIGAGVAPVAGVAGLAGGPCEQPPGRRRCRPLRPARLGTPPQAPAGRPAHRLRECRPRPDTSSVGRPARQQARHRSSWRSTRLRSCRTAPGCSNNSSASPGRAAHGDLLLAAGGIAYDRSSGEVEKAPTEVLALRPPQVGEKRLLWKDLPGTAREHEQIWPWAARSSASRH